jgi:hypothetical protein
MPGMDRTGPLGQGPLTGRGLGPCGAGFRRGFGRGMGRGFGFRRFAMAPQTMELTPANEKQILQEELKEIELEKKEIEKRLKELKE